MEELVKFITETYGLGGVLLIAPYVALGILYKDYRKNIRDHEKTKDELGAKLSACEKDCSEKMGKIYEQRVADAQAISEKLVEMAAEQSALNRETNIALLRIGDTLNSVQTVVSHRSS
jgi:hypothetical protein